jgi:regulator of cell morphogenesis and NO signaling
MAKWASRSIFNSLKALCKAIIESLENDHDGAGILIKKIIKETRDFQAPDYACPTMKAVYQKLHDLSDDIFLHIAKENSVLFKRYE